MVSTLRTQRIADRIREELSEMLVNELSDPRLVGISVTDVKVDRELTWADIYVSAIEGSIRAKAIIEGLENAQGFIRRVLAGRIELRIFPRLRFHWDPTLEHADHMEKLYSQIKSLESAEDSKSSKKTDDHEIEI